MKNRWVVWFAISGVAVLAALLLGTLQASADDDADSAGRTNVAIFAGGCFWCVEADFEKIDGVLDATSGYTGGSTENPTYKEVSAGGTGHTEAVQIVFDPTRVSYEELLDHFWHSIDPTVSDRQFCDVGSQYRSGIFYGDEAQREAAERSRAVLDRSKPFAAPIRTEITAASTFYVAETYHQDYAKKNPLRYRYYRHGCGRDKRLAQLWGGEK